MPLLSPSTSLHPLCFRSGHATLLPEITAPAESCTSHSQLAPSSKRGDTSRKTLQPQPLLTHFTSDLILIDMRRMTRSQYKQEPACDSGTDTATLGHPTPPSNSQSHSQSQSKPQSQPQPQSAPTQNISIRSTPIPEQAQPHRSSGSTTMPNTDIEIDGIGSASYGRKMPDHTPSKEGMMTSFTHT